MVVAAVVLTAAIAVTVIDVVGWSDREYAQVSGGVAEASLAVRDFGYVPALITTRGLLPVRVTIHNQGVHTHTFTIDSLGVDLEIPRGETKVVTLQLPRAGRFMYYCRFHQSFGMRGHLVVEAD